MDNVIISNREDFENKKKIFGEQGNDKVHVVADFDGTLTKAFFEGKKVRAIITQLYEGEGLTEDYREKAQALHDKYVPIEHSKEIPLEEKKSAMDEWWRTHKKLLIDSGLNIEDVKKIVNEGYLKFRDHIEEFLDFLKNNKIPMVVLSATGLGEAIPMYFKKIGMMNENIHIVTNSMEYDEGGNAIGIKEPIIHSLNKGEIALKGLPIMEELREKKNVILLGDKVADLNMIDGFDYDNIIRIGFFNYQDEQNLEEYKEKFDIIITNDGSFEFVNELLKEILDSI